MFVIIKGLPFFAEKLSKDLNSVDCIIKYIFLNTYYSKIDKIKFLILLPFSKGLISLNGVSNNSFSLNWAILWRKKIIFQWMGTDCLFAIKRFNNNTIVRRYIDAAYNYIDCSWQYEEIKSIGINPKHLFFNYTTKSILNKKYNTIKILSYVAESRQKFYGMDKICELAKIFPKLNFEILGVTHSEYECPPNISLLGWRSKEEVEKLMKESAIFMRLTDHDGFSVSVLEALGFGCEVIWTYEFKFTHYSKTIEDTKIKIIELIEKIKSRGLIPNFDQVDKIYKLYNKELILNNYKQEINKIIFERKNIKINKINRVLINGIPLFSKRLVNDLKSFDSINSYYYANTYYSLFQKIRFMFLLPFSDLVISFNGVSDKSGSLNYVLVLKKKLIMQWHGTDVLLAIKRDKNNSILRKYINYSSHFTDSDWLKTDLETIISEVKILKFKYINLDENTKTYSCISFLSYMGEGREFFYGYNEIKTAAIKFSNYVFNIIGTKGKGLEILPNIIFHGWVDEKKVKELMIDSAIYIRLTKHDGNSISVYEALGFGAEVIWSYPTEFTYLARTSNELIEQIEVIVDKVKTRNYAPNNENFLYIKNNFNKKEVIQNYIQKINEFANKK